METWISGVKHTYVDCNPIESGILATLIYLVNSHMQRYSTTSLSFSTQNSQRVKSLKNGISLKTKHVIVQECILQINFKENKNFIIYL